MRFPDKLDVLTVHARLISETGGTGGIRAEGLFESALAAYYIDTYAGTIDRSSEWIR